MCAAWPIGCGDTNDLPHRPAEEVHPLVEHLEEQAPNAFVRCVQEIFPGATEQPTHALLLAQVPCAEQAEVTFPLPPLPPVVQDGVVWFFHDENGERHGPFPTMTRALDASGYYFEGLRKKAVALVGEPPLPPLRQIGFGWWFHDEHGGLRGPFDQKYDALRGLEIRIDCVVHKQDVLTFRSPRYRFLSNFWQVSVDYEGLTYPSTEHAFQAAKSLVPTDRENIRRAPNCATAKSMGKYVKLRENWEDIKVDVMLELLRQKFYTDPLEHWLLCTGDAKLVEGNTWGDAFWGVTQNGTGSGRNELGRLLMDVRAELREEGGEQG